MDTLDRELIDLTLQGDDEAFHRLYEKYVKKVYNLAYRMVGRDGDPEELTQEIFFQVFKNLKNFKGKSQFYTWLYRVATNTCLQHRRKRSRGRGTSSFDELAETAPNALPSSGLANPEDEAGTRLLREDIAKAIAGLTENQKTVMILGPVQGHSYDEMSEILGVSVTVIKGRLHRARESMRSLFNRRDEADLPKAKQTVDPLAPPATEVEL